jgi:hypothetical protein
VEWKFEELIRGISKVRMRFKGRTPLTRGVDVSMGAVRMGTSE